MCLLRVVLFTCSVRTLCVLSVLCSFWSKSEQTHASRYTYILCECVCVCVWLFVVELPWQQHGTRVCCAICSVLSEEHTPWCQQQQSHSQTLPLRGTPHRWTLKGSFVKLSAISFSIRPRFDSQQSGKHGRGLWRIQIRKHCFKSCQKLY